MDEIDPLSKARKVLEAKLRFDPSDFEDLAKRIHRIEGLRIDGAVLHFRLERHPDDWTSIQHYRFDSETGQIVLEEEEVVELYVTWETLIRRDLDNFWDGCPEMFASCSSDEEVEEEARKFAEEALPNIAESWYYPEEIENASTKIQAVWDEAVRLSRENYVEAFVDRAREEWQRRQKLTD